MSQKDEIEAALKQEVGHLDGDLLDKISEILKQFLGFANAEYSEQQTRKEIKVKIANITNITKFPQVYCYFDHLLKMLILGFYITFCETGSEDTSIKSFVKWLLQGGLAGTALKTFFSDEINKICSLGNIAELNLEFVVPIVQPKVGSTLEGDAGGNEVYSPRGDPRAPDEAGTTDPLIPGVAGGRPSLSSYGYDYDVVTHTQDSDPKSQAALKII